VFINDFASNMVRNLGRGYVNVFSNNGIRGRVEDSGIRDNFCSCLHDNHD
jgi:hypothetical protein